MSGRVLVVAGSDSGGGAGIQADLKTVTALGGYAATAVTALTAQNTLGVFGIVGVEPAFIAQQMRVVLEDLGADCVKTGMLHHAAVIDAVVDVLERAAVGIPVVADPVMYAKGGDALLDPEAVETLIRRLLPRAALITPNVREAEALSGLLIGTGTGGGAGQGRASGRRDGDRLAGLAGRCGSLYGSPAGESPYPRFRLHPGLGDCRRAGPGSGAECRSAAGAGLCAGGDPHCARLGAGLRPAASWAYRPAFSRLNRTQANGG